MGLFDFFLGVDITENWQPDSRLQLKFDFDESALCGVRLGQPVNRLEALGPAEDKRDARRSTYRYYSKGLTVYAEDDRILAFMLSENDPLRPEFQPYAGTCTLHRRPLALTADTSLAEFIEHFGEPDHQDDEGGVYYETKDVVLDVEFGDDDRLKFVIIGLPGKPITI